MAIYPQFDPFNPRHRKLREQISAYEAQQRELAERRRREERERMQYEMMQNLQSMQSQLTGWDPGFYPPSMPGMPLPPEEREINPLEGKPIEALKNAEPRKVVQRVPDSVQPLIGWRAWRTTVQNGELRLQALGQNHIWEPKQPMKAECVSRKVHPAPNKECGCGIWTLGTLEKLQKAVKGQSNISEIKVLGTCHLWGRIVECEHGFRAQFAYPAELWLLDSSMEELGYTYGVKIRTA